MQRSDVSSSPVSEANLRSTAILDFTGARVQGVVGRLGRDVAAREFLRAGYQLLREQVRAVYSVDELQPTSRTLAKGAGSCSQRFACLESIARAAGIATRVHGLWIAGRFWNPRFRLTKSFIPSRIL